MAEGPAPGWAVVWGVRILDMSWMEGCQTSDCTQEGGRGLPERDQPETMRKFTLMPSEPEAPRAAVNSSCPRVPKNLSERHPSPSSGAFGSSPEAVIASDQFARILNQFINIWNIIPQEETC